MSIASEITRINTNIANSYTAVDNKNGTLPQVQNSANLASAIDSIEVIESATAEGESISLVNTKAMPYSGYVVKGKSEQEGTPSQSNPSEIHSVADDVNLFDKDTNITLNKSFSSAGDIIDLPYICLQNEYIKVNQNTNYTLSTTTDVSGVPDTRLVICEYDNNKNFIQRNLGISVQSYSVKTTATTKYIRISAPNISLNTLSLKKGSTLLPYSPYNQGTVTIKQRGKNVAYTGWAEDFVNRINNNTQAKIETKDNKNCLFYTAGAGYGDYDNKYMFKTEWKENTQYTIQCSILNTSEQITNNYNMTVHYTDGTYTHIFNSYQQNTWLNFKFTTALNKTVKYITSAYYAGDRYLDLDTFMVYEGTEESSYEPYQTPHDYTFQTEPLRSLPNGVKDTIEEDGIHRKVGSIVLDGTETWNIASDYGFNTNYTEASGYIAFITNLLHSLSLNTTTTTNCLSNYNSAMKWLSLQSKAQTGLAIIRYASPTNITRLWFAIPRSIATTENEFKTWLSTHNVKIYDELAQETIEPLTQNQATTMLDIIKTGSYEDTTNIYTDEDVKPTMKVGYYKKS